MMDRRVRSPFPALLVGLATLLLAACGRSPATTVPIPTPSASPISSASPSPSQTPSQTPTPAGSQPVWGTYAAPRYTAITPIPPPFGRLALPEGMRVLALVGLDSDSPFTGRSDAILLVLYHPRLSKASLVSVPPDLFVYLPGYGMQRLSSAYALGGAPLLLDTLEYNLGLHPDDWLVVNLDVFANLVDAMGGITVPVMEALPGQCGEILYPGLVPMDGAQALCYARLRFGEDETARSLRQQQLARQLLLRLVQNGNLVHLKDLYQDFNARVDTSLVARDALDNVSLLLNLGDPNRLGYFVIGPDQTTTWQISAQPPASVFLPRRDPLAGMLDQAIAFADQPMSLSDVVVTLQYELTVSPTPTLPPTETPVPTPSDTPVLTATELPTITLMPSITPTPTPTTTNTMAP
jgi:LCP family protein required for cell wall assembly